MTDEKHAAGEAVLSMDGLGRLRRNLPTPGGRECGANMVRMTEPAIAELAAAGELDERCSTCAFRLGTLPNGCVETVMDAMKCGMEGKPFYCHDRRRKGDTCHGWFAMRYALDGKSTEVPWKYSDEYGNNEQAA
jgi:hypothetical protein